MHKVILTKDIYGIVEYLFLKLYSLLIWLIISVFIAFFVGDHEIDKDV